MAVLATLKVEVQGIEYVVTGDSFPVMLERVKSITGRRWDGSRTLWVVPGTVEDVRSALEGLQVLGGDEELLNAEIERVLQFQEWILEDVEAIKQEIEKLEADRGGYTSKWRTKAAKRTGATCLRYALKSASKKVEELSEPEINGLKRACEIMGWL